MAVEISHWRMEFNKSIEKENLIYSSSCVFIAMVIKY